MQVSRQLLPLRCGYLSGRTPIISCRSTISLQNTTLVAYCMSTRRAFGNNDAISAVRSPKRRKIQKGTSPSPQPVTTRRGIMDLRDKPIPLTEVESTLRELLLDVASYVDKNPSAERESSVSLPEELSKAKVELRFTGGWVRDKLLGVDSHDIDVAINKMTGYQFGLKLKEYLELPGVSTKYGLDGVAQDDRQSAAAENTHKSKIVGGLHKIEANPEKSKHLETVTTRIFGLDIDLVNLRKESYTEDSRNPQMEFGTPEEDALRRDATVNAMFYNLSTSQVEDFTGQGFDDMEKRIIRTPLEPFQTFKDDPLRVLRLIRFASRLGYKIDPAAQDSMKDDDIKEALKIKISRERIGVELEKMLKGSDPRTALHLIHDLDLYHTIFTNPISICDFVPELTQWHAAYDTLEALIADTKEEISCFLLRNPEERYLAWTLCALTPWGSAPERKPAKPGAKTPPPFAADIAREGIKTPSKICDIVTAAIRNSEDIKGLVQQVSSPIGQTKLKNIPGRDILGMAIRKWGATWRSQVIFSLLHEILAEPESRTDLVRNYKMFLQQISSLGLLEAYTFKPLLDGKALAKALGTPPGPWMKDALEVVMAWQLRDSDNTDPSTAIEEVRLNKENKNGGELTACLIDHFLQLTIRPLFAKTPRTVTSAGRKKLNPDTRPYQSIDDEEDKPWKTRERSSINLLRWILNKIDPERIERNWPLLIPPILTILDDSDPLVKSLGCEFAAMILSKTPPALLIRTGLGDVFEEVLMSCLTYLPTLTPEDQSVVILDAAFPALITLSNAQFPVQPSRKEHISNQQKRAKFLDQVLRRGVLSGFTYAGEYVKIAIILLKHLKAISNELGVELVRHLKDILPLLSRILGDPFAPASPELMLAAARAEQAAILNAWPRISYHRGEILKGIISGWIHVIDSGSTIDEVNLELRETVEMLMTAVKGEVDIVSEFTELMAADDRLKPLFAGLV